MLAGDGRAVLMGVSFEAILLVQQFEGACADTPRDAPSVFPMPGASWHRHLWLEMLSAFHPFTYGILSHQNMPCRNSVHHGRNARCPTEEVLPQPWMCP